MKHGEIMLFKKGLEDAAEAGLPLSHKLTKNAEENARLLEINRKAFDNLRDEYCTPTDDNIGYKLLEGKKEEYLEVFNKMREEKGLKPMIETQLKAEYFDYEAFDAGDKQEEYIQKIIDQCNVDHEAKFVKAKLDQKVIWKGELLELSTVLDSLDVITVQALKPMIDD